MVKVFLVFHYEIQVHFRCISLRKLENKVSLSAFGTNDMNGKNNMQLLRFVCGMEKNGHNDNL